MTDGGCLDIATRVHTFDGCISHLLDASYLGLRVLYRQWQHGHASVQDRLDSTLERASFEHFRSSDFLVGPAMDGVGGL